MYIWENREYSRFARQKYGRNGKNMKCPNCGFENEEGAAFCGGCGEDLSSENIMNALDESAKQTDAKADKKSV